MTLQPTVNCPLPTDLAVFPLVSVLQEKRSGAEHALGSEPPVPPPPSAAAMYTAADV
jgi:hypothetical protein